MPLSYVDISGDSTYSWADLCKAISDCIKFTVDNDGSKGIRIFPFWVYEIDSFTLLGKLTNILKVDKTGAIEDGKVHCWTIGIASANFIKVQSGVPDIIGSRNGQWSWEIKLDVWGFFDNDGKEQTQRSALNEARLVSASLWRNADVIVSSNQYLRELRPLEFSNLSPTPFSDGQNVIVASGSMFAVISEGLQH